MKIKTKKEVGMACVKGENKVFCGFLFADNMTDLIKKSNKFKVNLYGKELHRHTRIEW